MLLIDHADAPGKKILISGGGRCNFTNIHTAPDRFLSANPHFAKSALGRYGPQDFIALVERHGIAWHEKTLGQLFCDGSARQIVDLLLEECDKGGVDDRARPSGERDRACRRAVHGDDRRRAHGTAPALVIATGGPSIPKMGATGFAYDLARRFGLASGRAAAGAGAADLGRGRGAVPRAFGRVAPRSWCVRARPRSARRPVHPSRAFGPGDPADLVLLAASATAIGVEFPARSPPDWLVADEARRGRARRCAAFWRAALPDRLAETLVERIGIGGRARQRARSKRCARPSERLRGWRFAPNGTEGFAKAEVTAGGISTAELSSQTMEAKRVPGLYAIGEAVDVTGWLGGYNFQWAWASGWAASQAI